MDVFISIVLLGSSSQWVSQWVNIGVWLAIWQDCKSSPRTNSGRLVPVFYVFTLDGDGRVTPGYGPWHCPGIGGRHRLDGLYRPLWCQHYARRVRKPLRW